MLNLGFTLFLLFGIIQFGNYLCSSDFLKFMPTHSKASLYMVIPPHILKNESLDWTSKILYAAIEQLCSLEEDYCWASNKYFEDLFGIAERTIRRKLNDLESSGLIHVEFDINSKGTLRKIYVNSKNENNAQGGQIGLPRADKMATDKSKSKRKSLNSSSLSENPNTDSIAETAQSVLSKSEKRKLNRLRKTLYPKDFSIAQPHREKLLSEHPITDKDIDFCFKEFKQYHTEGDGQIKKHINWELTFTKWVGRALDYGKIGKNKKTNEISQRVTPSKRACKDCTADTKCRLHEKMAKLKTDPRYARNS